MRRSKSDPSKYARNYRRISQRRMTEFDEAKDEEKEMERLRSVLRNSEAHLVKANEREGEDSDDGGVNIAKNKKRRRNTQKEEEEEKEKVKNNDTHTTTTTTKEEKNDTNDPTSSILSPELTAEISKDTYGTDNCDALILPPRKKKNKTKPKVQLTPEEIRQAKLLHKNTTRKLKQLSDRAAQKKRRAVLYDTLQKHSLKEEERVLLSRSSNLGKRESKKEKLQKLVRKEKAGMVLTKEEKDMLYTERGEEEEGRSFEKMMQQQQQQQKSITDSADDPMDENYGMDEHNNNTSTTSGKKKKKKKKNGGMAESEQIMELENDSKEEKEKKDIDEVEDDNDEIVAVEKTKKDEKKQKNEKMDIDSTDAKHVSFENDDDKSNNDNDDDDDDPPTENSKPKKIEESISTDTNDGSQNNKTTSTTASAASFAAQMMAGLSTLKTESITQKIKLDQKEAEEAEEAQLEQERLEEEERKKRKKYIPSEPIKIEISAPSSRKGTANAEESKTRKVLTVNRPDEIKESRYDLPVSAMEFEIIDAVRSNDAVILCGETGSGKSTQVPQFLYESGLTLGSNSSSGSGSEQKKKEDDSNGELLIGVTQPRRVAAVSTAKRVCYEMGHGNGQSILGPKKGQGNLVAYQTRYETAGLGKSTRIKFMTDGILLQEIRDDLLLRKYGAIVLDEAHERNLNTDVLLGLLSVALPLRRKAAEEGSMPPLKLIVMSATLRVEDFTANPRLFPGSPPTVVKVPGRTFPVTVHHSKVTELDDYETVAFNKVCKIHRKLPPGGILVFLTGKQEIIRMVNRLRKSLGPKEGRGRSIERCKDSSVPLSNDAEANVTLEDGTDGLRDMDDDEIDGDLFQKDNAHDDYDDVSSDEENDGDAEMKAESVEKNRKSGDGDDDEGPKNVLVLPLYSMLSVEEQAKVFAPVPEGHRLIVVATNIAETSITIPGISYVVDTGRQKCRNYHAATGVASYDVMWISKASADQRAGRAGRTGPGHCYRLYSSSLYARHLDPFALPEVLTRPLEDVVLAMKAMNVSNVASFPFPTAPNQGQINAAIQLLANIGCVEVSNVEKTGGDGTITRLGAAVAKLPLGVRYGKILLIASNANVLDYAIAMVSVLSESNPLTTHSSENNSGKKESSGQNVDKYAGLDEVDRNAAIKKDEEKKRQAKSKWSHNGGDILAGLLAVGAYSYAGREGSGASKTLLQRKFCEENGLNFVVMQRIHKMRVHLARLVKTRLANAEGVAAKTGGILSSMPPPKKFQENLLRQAIAAGFLDNVARRALPGSIDDDCSMRHRASYMSCRSTLRDPLFIDRNSVVYSGDSRKLPEWVCFDTIVRKTTKDGSTISTMKNVTPLDVSWLAALSEGTQLISLGSPLDTPAPRYDDGKDAIMCSIETKFGDRRWHLPPLQLGMQKAFKSGTKKTAGILLDDSFRWFARYLLEGKVLKELHGFPSLLNDDPAIITRKKPVNKVSLIVCALSGAGIDSASALRKHWAQKDSKFLFRQLKPWTKKECVADVKRLWMSAVKQNISALKNNR